MCALGFELLSRVGEAEFPEAETQVKLRQGRGGKCRQSRLAALSRQAHGDLPL